MKKANRRTMPPGRIIGSVRYFTTGERIYYRSGEEDEFVAAFVREFRYVGPSGVGYSVRKSELLLRYRLYCAVVNEFGVGPGDKDFLTMSEFINNLKAAQA